jgi:excisionase family DNA binding protein
MQQRPPASSRRPVERVNPTRGRDTVVRVKLEKDVLTTGDVARLCRVTIRTVINWFEAGRLEGYRLPGSRDRRFTRDAVMRFLRENDMPVEELGLGPNRGARVLVVDDDRAVRVMIDRYLRSLGTLEVETAGSGWEAGLKTAVFKPNVLLLDYRLGDTTGEQVVAAIRELVLEVRPSIVVMSAHLAEEDVERIFAGGADAFLRKPFELDVLRDTVLRHAGVVQ